MVIKFAVLVLLIQHSFGYVQIQNEPNIISNKYTEQLHLMAHLNTNRTQEITLLWDSLFITSCDTIIDDAYFDILELDTPIIYATTTPNQPVYCSPGWRSEVLGQMPGGQHVHVGRTIARSWVSVKSAEDQRVENPFNHLGHHTVVLWHEIDYHDQKGYVYGGALRKSSEYEAEQLFWLNGGNVASSPVEFNLFDGQDTLSHQFDYMFHGARTTEVNDLALDKTDRVYYYETFRESCPGHTFGQFLIQVEDTLIPSPIWESTGEANFYESTILYLPYRKEDGEVVLIKNGDPEYLHDITDVEYGYLPIPTHIQVPIEHLLASKRFYTEDVFDAEGEPVYLEGEDWPEVIEKEDPPVFYYWNGKSFELLE